MHNLAVQNKFNNRIKEFRILCDLDQAELAKLLTATRQSISRWENSNYQKDPKKSSFPSQEHRRRLAEVFTEKLDRQVKIEDIFYVKCF